MVYYILKIGNVDICICEISGNNYKYVVGEGGGGVIFFY